METEEEKNKMSSPTETSVYFEVQGQHAQDPHRWSVVGRRETEPTARFTEGEYRVFNDLSPQKGWLDFRIVRVTSTREILSNKDKQI